MTDKRFKNVEEKLDWGTVQYFRYNDEKITDDEIEDLVNQLLEENEQLKKEIKDMKIRFKRKYDYEFDEIVDELW